MCGEIKTNGRVQDGKDVNEANKILETAYLSSHDRENNLYNDFEVLWRNHLEGLLYEYLRGTSNIELKIERLKTAYNDKEKH